MAGTLGGLTVSGEVERRSGGSGGNTLLNFEPPSVPVSVAIRWLWLWNDRDEIGVRRGKLSLVQYYPHSYQKDCLKTRSRQKCAC